MEEKTSIPTFGTGGIRGIMGKEINNDFFRRAAAATATYLRKIGAPKTVWIGYDTRHHSETFAQETARTMNTFGITTYLAPEPVPVPLVSFVTKREKIWGIMITASHNPKEYNGFKVYSPSGGQLLPGEAAAIEACFPRDAITVPTREKSEKGLFRFGGKGEEAAYLTAVTRYRPQSKITVVATPLHGAAWKILPAALKKCGHNVIVPKEQATPDGDFPKVAAPNPEDPEVFAVSKSYAADLLLATDGDGDRCGCCVHHRGEYHHLSGNDTAAILLFYLTREKYPSLPKGGYIACSDVSGSLGAAIARDAGLAVRIVPTGFKFIGELIAEGDGAFFAGYEESGGFLHGDHAADKDGIATAVLLAEAAAYYKNQGRTLLDVLEEIRARYGREYTVTRKYPIPEGNIDLTAITLPSFQKEVKGNAVFFTAGKGIKIALRPSGTEPYIKSYVIFFANDDRKAAAVEKEISSLLAPFLTLQKEQC
ncbi:MAG: phospho-sugar mutase [Firmicutes bacterium]|nr:phospho-sugar mutase [Bacillota bacterium]